MKKPKVAEEVVDLRRGIDHIGVGVTALVHDGNGKILLMKRGQKARDEQGRWDICGGAIEFGESITDALKRELKEELCVEPLSFEFLAVYDAHRHDGGRSTHWVQVLHAVLIEPLSVKIGEPHKIEQLGWFNNDSLPSPLHSQFEKNYKIAKQRGIIK